MFIKKNTSLRNCDRAKVGAALLNSIAALLAKPITT